MVNFQQVYNRINTKSLKWDQAKILFKSKEVLPMWVADMDFRAPDEVNNALKERAEHGFYGYTIINEQTKNIVKDWISSKHDWEIDTDWLVFSPGVITSLHTAIQTSTNPGDKILLQTPVYTPFFEQVKGAGRKIIENPLSYDGEKYEIDFTDFEAKLKSGVKAFILCSPHNPVGRVWTKEELTKMAELCLAYDVIIFSDEIHADLVYSPYKHIPVASLSEEIAQNTVTCMSPTKTFNLAGLQASYIVISDATKRKTIQKQLGLQGFNMLNTFGIIALETSYQYGGKWLNELMAIFTQHKQYARERLMGETNNLIHVIDSEATYLLWLDCSKLKMDDRALQEFMMTEAKVGLNAGSAYGKQGEQFMRLNIACPKATLEEGIDRIVHACNKLSQ